MKKTIIVLAMLVSSCAFAQGRAGAPIGGGRAGANPVPSVPAATTSRAGTMSAADKVRLNALFGDSYMTSTTGRADFFWSDSGTTNVYDPLRLRHYTSGTAAAGFGVGLTFLAEDDGGTAPGQGRISTNWIDASAASNDSQMTFELAVANSDLSTVATIDGTTGAVFSVPKLRLSNVGALTNTVATLAEWSHTTSGTAAAGFGGRHIWHLESAGDVERAAAYQDVKWATATNGSESATLAWNLTDGGALYASGSEPFRLTSAGALTIAGSAPSLTVGGAVAGTTFNFGSSPGRLTFDGGGTVALTRHQSTDTGISIVNGTTNASAAGVLTIATDGGNAGINMFSTAKPSGYITGVSGSGLTDVYGANALLLRAANNEVFFASAGALRGQIQTGGGWVLGNGALATNATEGHMQIPTTAGTPTGTPATVVSGMAPMVWDSTNNKLCVYDADATWHCSAAM